MILMRTWLTVADNSGARRLMCILPVGGDAGLKAGLGDIVTASVKEATPESQVKEGKVVRAVIVRMRNPDLQRGSYHRITGTQPFGLIGYGYAYATSYSYVGGLNLEKINPIE